MKKIVATCLKIVAACLVLASAIPCLAEVTQPSSQGQLVVHISGAAGHLPLGYGIGAAESSRVYDCPQSAPSFCERRGVALATPGSSRLFLWI